MTKRFDIEKAQRLGEAISRANVAQMDYLAEHFPAGYRCDVLLNAAQKDPAPAHIAGVAATQYSGNIVVTLGNAKKHTRLRTRRLSPEQVLNVRPEGE